MPKEVIKDFKPENYLHNPTAFVTVALVDQAVYFNNEASGSATYHSAALHVAKMSDQTLQKFLPEFEQYATKGNFQDRWEQAEALALYEAVKQIAFQRGLLLTSPLAALSAKLESDAPEI